MDAVAWLEGVSCGRLYVLEIGALHFSFEESVGDLRGCRAGESCSVVANASWSCLWVSQGLMVEERTVCCGMSLLLHTRIGSA